MNMEDTFLELRTRQRVSTMLCNKSEETVEATMEWSQVLLTEHFYMDDFVTSVASEEEAVDKYKNLRKSLADHGFQLTKWICNSEKLMEEIPSEDRSVWQSKTFEAEPLAPSILGLQWNVESDGLEIRRGTGKDVPAKVTQRIVLSQVSSVFDVGTVFSFHSQDEIVAQKNFGRNMGNRGTKSNLQKTRLHSRIGHRS